jgi:DNA-binding MarR family transcriptional regulator
MAAVASRTGGTGPKAGPAAAPESASAAEAERLSAAFREMMASLRRLRGRQSRAAGGDLTHAQFELLACLLEQGELHAGELAHAAQVSPATVSGMLDQLVASGHVARVRSERDRRVVVCRLTPEGRARIEAKKVLWQGHWQEALGDLPPRDLAAAARVLHRIAAMFEHAAADPATAPPMPSPANGARARRNGAGGAA